MKTTITFIIYLIVITACATTDKSQQRFIIYEKYISEHKLLEVAKIKSFQFRNWRALDDKHLLLSGSHKKQYLLTLMSYCADLNFTHSIGLQQTMSHTLDAKFDAIIIATQPNIPCKIKTIHEISQEQEKEIISLRKEP